MINKNEDYPIVYIRQDYLDISEMMFAKIKIDRNFQAMVFGNPGIGKSYFYLYMIFKFIKENTLLCGRTLVINSDNSFFKFNSETGEFEEANPKEVKYDKNVLRLVDGKTSDNELTSWFGSTILFASPSDQVNNKPATFMKGHEGFYLMSVWSETELLIVNQLLKDNVKQTEDMILEKVAIAGPIPRLVLMVDQTVDDVKRIIKHAVDSIGSPTNPYVRQRETVKESNYSHKLLKMSSNTTFCSAGVDFTVSFLSAHIADLVIGSAQDEVKAEFKLFALNHTDSDSSKFRGNIYEFFIHRLMPTLFPGASIKALPDNGVTLSTTAYEIVIQINGVDIDSLPFFPSVQITSKY